MTELGKTSLLSVLEINRYVGLWIPFIYQIEHTIYNTFQRQLAVLVNLLVIGYVHST